jgi:hypothetical protein
MKKSAGIILLEASIIGAVLIGIFLLIELCNKFIFINKLHLLINIFISGFIFHILCEISGLNIWYVNNYNEILKK